MSTLLTGISADPDSGQAAAAPVATESFLVFRLGELWCAVAALDVKEVVPRSKTVPVPQTPPFVLGLVNISGRVVVVIDVAALLGGAAADAVDAEQSDAPRRDLVLLSDGMPVGARVDEVIGLADVPLTQVQALPAEDGAAIQTFDFQAHPVTVLSVSRLLALAESRVGGA